MLGDNLEKPKNPLKKAIRRRNTKQVQFTAPTYYEASDVDYSTEEEEEVDGDYNAHEDENQDSQSQDPNKDSKDDAADDQTKPKAENDGNSISESHVSVESRDTDGDQNTPVNGDHNCEETSERSGTSSPLQMSVFPRRQHGQMKGATANPRKGPSETRTLSLKTTV